MTVSSPQALLISHSPGPSISVSRYFVIGRSSDCDFIIDHPQVSPRHCIIEKQNQLFRIKDLQSAEGTKVNQTRIIEAFLEDGDQVNIGPLSYTFQTSLKEKNRELDLIPESKNSNWSAQLECLPRYANTDYPILILGESGCGKEILARSIHNLSARSSFPMVTLNCGALPESLAESELFGHSKGAFTGAQFDRKGVFETARGGTLFLDEIGELPISLQAKLLRAIENQEIRPVGSDKTITTDVRIVAATHPTLKEKIQKNQFRFDLYQRLNILSLYPPSLKDRMEDFEHLLYTFAKEFRVRFSVDALEQLKSYHWPGNIRELKNLVLRISATHPAEHITAAHITPIITANLLPTYSKSKITKNHSKIKDVEKELIIHSLMENLGNQKKVAADLGIPPSTLHDRIKTYQINPKSFRNLNLVSGL